ncbi:unnamed protein product [Amoebophrya sp. A120]|nr:unnamed protein product [Amoebophrya sp. A120]|eukprot:GSA120T00024043001.1
MWQLQPRGRPAEKRPRPERTGFSRPNLLPGRYRPATVGESPDKRPGATDSAPPAEPPAVAGGATAEPRNYLEDQMLFGLTQDFLRHFDKRKCHPLCFQSPKSLTINTDLSLNHGRQNNRSTSLGTSKMLQNFPAGVPAPRFRTYADSSVEEPPDALSNSCSNFAETLRGSTDSSGNYANLSSSNKVSPPLPAVRQPSPLGLAGAVAGQVATFYRDEDGNLVFPTLEEAGTTLAPDPVRAQARTRKQLPTTRLANLYARTQGRRLLKDLATNRGSCDKSKMGAATSRSSGNNRRQNINPLPVSTTTSPLTVTNAQGLFVNAMIRSESKHRTCSSNDQSSTAGNLGDDRFWLTEHADRPATTAATGHNNQEQRPTLLQSHFSQRLYKAAHEKGSMKRAQEVDDALAFPEKNKHFLGVVTNSKKLFYARPESWTREERSCVELLKSSTAKDEEASERSASKSGSKACASGRADVPGCEQLREDLAQCLEKLQHTELELLS